VPSIRRQSLTGGGASRYRNSDRAAQLAGPPAAEAADSRHC